MEVRKMMKKLIDVYTKGIERYAKVEIDGKVYDRKIYYTSLKPNYIKVNCKELYLCDFEK